MDNIYSAEEVIAEIFSRLDLKDTRDEAIFYNWIFSGLREIGGSSLDIVSECIDIVSGCADKPCNYGGLIELVLLDGHGSVPFVFTNTGAKTDRGDYYSNKDTVLYVSEEDKRFVISSNGDELKQIEVRYYALPVDDEGLPFVRERVKEAIISYCEYLWIKRERNRRRKEIPMVDMVDARKEWNIQKRTAKGRNKMVNSVEAESILRRWVTTIPQWKSMNRHHRGVGLNNRSY